MTAKPIVCACILVLAAAACAGAGEAPEAGTKLQADLFAREGPDILYAIGHVRLERGGNLITADGAVVWTRDQEAYLEGNVVYRLGESVLQAENVYVHWTTAKDPKTGKAETTIDRGFLVRANVLWHERPDRLPWHVRADEVVQTDLKRFMARRNVVMSTCDCYQPHTYFRASEVVLVANEKIIAKNLSYHVQGVALPPDAQGWWVPPMYWPKLYVPLGWNWPEMTFDAGTSSRFGTYVKTQVLYELPETLVPWVQAKAGGRLDYFGKRGVGFGGILEYEREDLVRGRLDYYRVPHDDGKDRRDFELGKTERQRIKFFHSQDVPEGWEFDVEFQRWSDAGFRQEYFEREFLDDKPIENRLYLKYADGPLAGYAHYRWQEDKWLDSTEYLPQIGLNVFSYPIWRNLIYTGHIEVANVRRRLSDLRLPPDPTLAEIAAADAVALRRDFIHDPLESTQQEFDSDGRRFWRFNTYHELAMPFDVSIFDIEPFVGTRQTYYQETLNDDHGAWRGMFVYGVRASTQFSKTWDNVESDGLRLFGARILPLEVHGLRHIITPEVRLMAVEDSGLNPDDLILTDDDGTIQPAADAGFSGFRRVLTGTGRQLSRSRLYHGYDTTGLAFGDVNDVYPFRVLNFGLRNRWQTHRGGRIVDLVDVDADVDVFLGDKEVNNGDTCSAFRLDFRFHPIEGISFFCDFDYNIGGNDYLRRRTNGTIPTIDDTFEWRDDSMRAFNAGLQIATSKRWQLFLSQRYEAGEAHELGFAFTYFISEKWRVTAQYEFDTRGSDPVELGLRISRDMHDWIVDLIIEDDRQSREKMVGISLQPKLRRELVSKLFYTRELSASFDAQRNESVQHYDY